MQEFNTRQVRHEFKVDGRIFWLPGLTLADLEAAASLQDMEPTDRVPAFRDFMLSRVRPRWRGRRAALRLNLLQLTALWRGWVGVPGEALGSSHGSSESTATSSPSTSAPSTTSESPTSGGTNSQP